MSETSNALAFNSRPQEGANSDVHHDTVAIDLADCEQTALESSTSVNSGSSRLSADVDANPEKYAVLRVECVEAKALKAYTIVRFFVQTLCQGVWGAAFAFNFIPSKNFYDHPLLTNSLVLAAICGPVAFAASLSFMQALLKASKAKQIWTKRRRRLAMLQLVQLILLVISNFFLAMSSGIARHKTECQIYTPFCAWCDFLIWSGLIGVLTIQSVLTHNACAWTNAEGKPTRILLMQKWVQPREAQPHALILDASWLVHVPKAVLWALIQVTLFMQVGDAMSGRPYSQLDCNVDEHGVCRLTNTYHSATQMRIAFLSLQQFFMALTTVQGIQDMHHLPYNVGRLGRVLMRLRISRDMGLNHGGMLGVGLLLSTALRHLSCSSCLQSWLLLASNLQATSMVVLASFLFMPVSSSSSSHLIMQVWLQHFAWTERSVANTVKRRGSVGSPQDQVTLAQEPIFCFETAVKMLYWCGLAYEYQEGRADLRLSEDTAMQLYGCQHLHLLRDGVTGTKCLLAWGPASLVIVFRGTANLKNAAHDAKAWLVPLGDDSTSSGCAYHAGPAVHSGFRASWHSSLKASALSFIRETVCSDADKASGIHVRIAGHSLGGVMAVIAAMDIADLRGWASLQVYTIGAPRPGNRAFSKLYSSKVPDTWHIINEKDPVPLLAKFGALYVRPGHRVLITPGGDMMVRPTPLDHKLNPTGHRVNRHYLTSYRSSLVEVIRTQLRQPKFEHGMEGVLELAESVDLTSALLAADLDVKTPKPSEAAAASISSALTPDHLAV